MLDEYGFELYEENQFPIAYLLTFRTYGTWLPGDPRGSYKRDGGRLGIKRIDSNLPLHESMVEAAGPSVLLNEQQRNIVSSAIHEVCQFRACALRALNVRSNHVHAVASKAIKPEKLVNDFKAYATRALRGSGYFTSTGKIWARGASTRYLWKPRHVLAAVDYVLYAQEDIPFEFRA